jgi:tRNA threonylcarbamoyladenosine biosynthesis protein TsaE
LQRLFCSHKLSFSALEGLRLVSTGFQFGVRNRPLAKHFEPREAVPSDPYEITSASADQTRTIGERLARVLEPGDVLLLHGDLGSGKTTLTQGIAHGLGITDYVQSPTFTLVAEHDGIGQDGAPIRLYHLDLYRLGGEEELDSIGFDDYLAPTDGISVIEWPERAAHRLPDTYLLIRLESLGPDRRRLTLTTTPTASNLATRIATTKTTEEAEETDTSAPSAPSVTQ